MDSINPPKPRRRQRRSARERLLAAARRAFYEEGVNTVGIDRVIERAGVAKASLYNTFGSKEELIRSYLVGAQGGAAARASMRRLATTARHRGSGCSACSTRMADICADPEFRGCAFLRASAESRARAAAADACATIRAAGPARLFVELAQRRGRAEPEQLAQQLVLLYDGAVGLGADGSRSDRGYARPHDGSEAARRRYSRKPRKR